MGSDLPYAKAVEDGHPSYTITPVSRQFLRFPKKGGGYAFVKQVTIPAREGVHYLRRALESVMSRNR